MWDGLENRLIAYADDATLYAPIYSPPNRIAVAESLNRDLIKIKNWCIRWGMRLNPNKIQFISVSRSLTVLPPYPPLYVGDSGISI